MTCSAFHEFMRAQQTFLERAIDETKWYLSERAGRDVGRESAIEHFWRNHLDHAAHDFRLRYCHGECPNRGTCPLAAAVDRLHSATALATEVAPPARLAVARTQEGSKP
ncbi:MAG: hypothetical protein WC789_12720 [Lentisphaeria bacterium]|jgi:hypothetical protein